MRSTAKQVVKGVGLKGLSLRVVVCGPWCSGPWAVPVLPVFAPSAQAHRQAKKRHKTTIDWTGQGVKVVSRWLRRPWVLRGDGAFACLRVAWIWVPQQVTLISRLRLDAQLYDFPPVPARPRRGPKPRQGVRLPALRERMAEAQRAGDEVELYW